MRMLSRRHDHRLDRLEAAGHIERRSDPSGPAELPSWSSHPQGLDLRATGPSPSTSPTRKTLLAPLTKGERTTLDDLLRKLLRQLTTRPDEG